LPVIVVIVYENSKLFQPSCLPAIRCNKLVVVSVRVRSDITLSVAATENIDAIHFRQNESLCAHNYAHCGRLTLMAAAAESV